MKISSYLKLRSKIVAHLNCTSLALINFLFLFGRVPNMHESAQNCAIEKFGNGKCIAAIAGVSDWENWAQPFAIPVPSKEVTLLTTHLTLQPKMASLNIERSLKGGKSRC